MFYKIKTDYGSPKQSIITMASIAAIALKNKIKHIVINDNTMYAIQKAYDELPKELKLIIGLQLYLCEDPANVDNVPLEFSLFAKNYEGYLAVCRIQTESQKHLLTKSDGKVYPTVTFDMLKETMEGSLGRGNVFLSTGGKDGIILGAIKKLNSKNGIDQKERGKLGEIHSKLLFIRSLKDKISELESHKSSLAALSKRKFNSEKTLYASMENPPISEVEDMLKRIEETENAKEQLKRLKLMVNSCQSDLSCTENSIAEMLGFSRYNEDSVIKFYIDSIQNIYGESVEDLDQWFDKHTANDFESKETIIHSSIRSELDRFVSIAGNDLLVDVESHFTETEKTYMPILCEVTKECGLRLIASHTATMVYKEDFMVKKAVNSLFTNKWSPEIKGEREEYIKSKEELRDSLYSCIGSYADEAIDNMSILENECNVEMVIKEHYPVYPCTEYDKLSDDDVLNKLKAVPLSIVKKAKDDDEELATMSRQDVLLVENAWKGALSRLDKSNSNTIPEEYKVRLEEELNTILTMGFSSYFLIVSNFYDSIGEKIGHMPDDRFEYLKENYQDMSLNDLEEYIYSDQSFPGLTVGFGRGSAAGSLVAYCTGITSIDPMKYGLLFSRFLSVARRSMPDVDSDLSTADEKYGIRDIVIDYCAKKYGYDCICGITTPQTFAARSSILAMGRVYGSYINKDLLSLSEGMSSLISKKPGARLSDYEKDIRERYGSNKDAMAILELSKRVEGLNWNTSKHSCGIIMTGDGEVSKYAPLLRDSETGSWKIEMDAETAETRKYLKMDFLGLNTLNQLTEISRLIYENHGVCLDLKNLPQEPEVYDAILASGLTNSVFQFESAGMKQMLKKFGRKTKKNPLSMNFDDIILLLACYRPGPMQYLDKIINQRQGNTISRDILKRIVGYSKEFAALVAPTNYDFHHYRQIIDTFKVIGNYSEDEAKLMFAYAKTHNNKAKIDFKRRASISAKDAGDLFDVIGCENAVTLLAKTCEELHKIVKPTYLAMVFQEQVMMTAINLAGYTMGESDELRQAMGHKKMSVLVAERPKFVKGCVAHGIDEEDADALFEEMLEFAKYAFNKSHAAAYAALSYCAAYLKFHYPTEFYTGMLNLVPTKKYSALINEASNFDIKVKVPCINKSKAAFTGLDKTIYFGFSGIKGISMNSALSFECGDKPYKSVADFVYRTGVSEAYLNALIDVGAFDSMLDNRAALKAISYDLCKENTALNKAIKEHDKELNKLMDLNDDSIDYCDKYQVKNIPSEDDLKEKIESLEKDIAEHKSMLLTEIIAPINMPDEMRVRIENERERLSLSVSMSALDLYEHNDTRVVDIDELTVRDNVVIIGEIRTMREISTKTGQKMCFLTIEDRTGTVDVTVFPTTYRRYENKLTIGAVLKFFGNVTEDIRYRKSEDSDEESEIKLLFLTNAIEGLEEKCSSYVLYLNHGLSEWLNIYPELIRFKTNTKGHHLLVNSGVSGRIICSNFKVDESILKEKKLKIKEI